MIHIQLIYETYVMTVLAMLLLHVTDFQKAQQQ